MTTTLSAAKEICTSAEYKLVASTFSLAKDKPSPARLAEKITLARRYRDKYRDLVKKSRIARQKKKGSKLGRVVGVGGSRTEIKAAIFDESLKRLNLYSAKVKTVTKKPVIAKKATANKTATKKAVSKKAVTKKKVSKKAATKKTSTKKKGTLARVLQKLAKKKSKKLQSKEAKVTTSRNAKTEAKGIANALTKGRNRGKQIGAHLRASVKRSQAKRDAR
jgi:hypothetical protein